MTFATLFFGGIGYCLGVAWLCCALWDLMSRFDRRKP